MTGLWRWTAWRDGAVGHEAKSGDPHRRHAPAPSTLYRLPRPSGRRTDTPPRGHEDSDRVIGRLDPHWALPRALRSGAGRCGPDDSSVARLSDNSERLYESDNGVLGRPHRSAASGRSGASETEMTQLRIDSLSLMYKKSQDPGNFPTASRRSARGPHTAFGR